MYRAKKDSDHTFLQLLDQEMSVSDLHDEDKEEALLVRMECNEGSGISYFDTILRDENAVALGRASTSRSEPLRYFVVV